MSVQPHFPQATPASQLVEGNLAFRRLSFAEAVAYLVGTNVGAAILSLPYAARSGGYPAVLIVGLASTLFAVLSHLLIAETMLRTPEVTQLIGLFRTYVFHGKTGRWYLGFLFAITIGVAIPSLTAYILGGAEAIQALTGLPHSISTAMFFIPGVAVVWLGLRATGYFQKVFSLLMGGALVLLTAFSIARPEFAASRLIRFCPYGILPILPIGVFTCMSQTSVPEIVRGLADRPALIPKAIRRALFINLGFVLIVPISVFGMLQPNDVSPMVTASWGATLGTAGGLAANLFALLALITSFWGSAGSILTNVVDVLRFPSDWNLKYRLLAFGITILPSIVLIVFNLVGFTGLIEVAGGFGGVLLALLPIWVWRRARKIGPRIPEYQVSDRVSKWAPWLMIAFYALALLAAAL